VESVSFRRGGGFEYLHRTLRVVEDDEKRIWCPGAQLGHPVSGGYKYGDQAFQVGRVSNLRQ
jgi:hypothetical protein